MAQGFSYFTRFLREDNNFQDPVTNNLNINNPQYPYSSIFTALFVALGLSVRIKAATDYYVDPSGGNDANNGSVGAPWRTFAHATAVLVTLDFFGQTVTLHLVNDVTEILIISPWTGGGMLLFDGGGHAIHTTGADAIQITGDIPGIFAYQNVTLQTTTSGFCVRHIGVGTVQQLAGVTFNVCAAAHLFVGGGGGALIELQNSYGISGGGPSHISCGQGMITSDLAPSAVTVTLTGNPQFPGNFVNVNTGGLFIAGINFSGTATGYQSGNVVATGVLNRGGIPNVVGGVNLPGNGLVTTASGGQLT